MLAGLDPTAQLTDAPARSLDPAGEYVAYAPDRLDEAGSAGIALDFLAQAGDLGVDAAVEDLPVATARDLHKGVAVEHAAGRRVNARRRSNSPVVSGTSAPAGDVSCLRPTSRRHPSNPIVSSGPAAGSPVCFAGRSRRSTLLTRACNLPQVKWLRYVVVRPDLQTDHPVHHLASSGEHDDGDVRPRADRLTRAGFRPHREARGQGARGRSSPARYTRASRFRSRPW